MIELSPQQLAAHPHLLGDCEPGPATLAEHVLSTGNGRALADRAAHPRTLALDCARHVLLRGDPDVLGPADLAPFAHRRVEAPASFLAVLDVSFDQVVPTESMVYLQQQPAAAPGPPRGVTIRPLTSSDAPSLVGLPADSAWIHASWGGPSGLCRSGHAWGAFRQGRLLAIACTYFRGGAHEEIAVVAAPGRSHQRLAVNCVLALGRDVAARGRTACWTCSRHDRASRLLAWTAGFRLVREYVHYATGASVVRGARVPA
ncbi:GNAT family N-acetyltransferase [Streptomyces sp. ASQP_92]|uniref:GNAT family N-acetyltransferase n=1 Tax=Streptomyces sp. ASQP_92 TaxID=2979116 RepID=UPI0021BE531A|nr:GNAT family N-acetyltransferase [Streptomyces sp. ASQP_92]MCT9088677.1 GNAT family N-acetyltransferase [Streptomyces sp. ASQP_92]